MADVAVTEDTAPIVGAPGTVAAPVVNDDGADDRPGPLLFDAATVNVYGVPPDKPVTEAESATGLPVTVNPEQAGHAGEAVIVYESIVAPPLLPGALQSTEADVAVTDDTVTLVGALGEPGEGVTVIDTVAVADAEPSVAVYVKVSVPTCPVGGVYINVPSVPITTEPPASVVMLAAIVLRPAPVSLERTLIPKR